MERRGAGRSDNGNHAFARDAQRGPDGGRCPGDLAIGEIAGPGAGNDAALVGLDRLAAGDMQDRAIG